MIPNSVLASVSTSKRFASLRAWVFGFMVSLAPSFAWAQLQPVPVFQAKGSVAIPDVADNTNYFTQVFDMSGYAGATVHILAHAVGCTAVRVYGSNDPSGTFTNEGVINHYWLNTTNSSVEVFSVAYTPTYIKFKFTTAGCGGAATNIVIDFYPFPTMMQTEGIMVNGAQFTSDSAIKPVIVGGIYDDGFARYPKAIKTDTDGVVSVTGTITPAPSPFVLDIHAPVAYQVTKLATTTVASPVGAGVIWKVRIQNLGNDELMIANVDPPTEAVAHRVQAGGDVWEVEWKDALYMKLKSDAATSPQVTPEDVRVTVMHY